MRGITFPNGPLQPGELERIAALHPTDVVDFQLFKDRWPLIVKAIPSVKLHARIVTGGRPNAANDANDLHQHYSPLCATIRTRNEVNKEGDGITAFEYYQYLVELGPKVQDLPVYVPAISPSGPDVGVWIYNSCLGCLEGGFKGLDVHVYGDMQTIDNILAEYRRLYSGPILITEYNFGAGNQYDLNQYANDWPHALDIATKHRASALCAFIWRWVNPDMELPTTVDVKDTPLELVFPMVFGETPVVGTGFKKAEPLVGPWLESEVYHWPGSQYEVSMAVGQKGVAIWIKSRNETYAMLNTGQIYADNKGGPLVKVR